jgi:hypothetical protein
MARKPSGPWWRASHRAWYVKLGGKMLRLGTDQAEAVRRFELLMSEHKRDGIQPLHHIPEPPRQRLGHPDLKCLALGPLRRLARHHGHTSQHRHSTLFQIFFVAAIRSGVKRYAIFKRNGRSRRPHVA